MSIHIQGQFVLETYFVMVIYGLIVCGNIMLIEAGDSKGEVSKMNVLLAPMQCVIASEDQQEGLSINEGTEQIDHSVEWLQKIFQRNNFHVFSPQTISLARCTRKIPRWRSRQKEQSFGVESPVQSQQHARSYFA